MGIPLKEIKRLIELNNIEGVVKFLQDALIRADKKISELHEAKQIDWEGKDTTVQKEAVAEDYGVFDAPDDFFPAHPQRYIGLKKFIYEKIGRKIMTKNVAKIRRYGELK